MLKIKYVVFILAAMFMTYSDADAQVRKRTTAKKNAKEKKESVSFLQKVNPEIKLGNVGFFNGLFISSKLNAGIKLHDRFSLGAGTKLFFNQYSQQGPDPSIFDIGGLVYGRAKITNSIYFQAEYAFMRYGKDPDGYLIRNIFENQKINYPLVWSCSILPIIWPGIIKTRSSNIGLAEAIISDWFNKWSRSEILKSENFPYCWLPWKMSVIRHSEPCAKSKGLTSCTQNLSLWKG
jgi:hypothetical protein